jgi:hypothetical protein
MWPDGPERKMLSRKDIPQNVDRIQCVTRVERDVCKSALTWGLILGWFASLEVRATAFTPRRDTAKAAMRFPNRRDSKMTRLFRIRQAYKCGQQHRLEGKILSEHPPIEASNRSISLIRVRPEKNE